jgi:deazaflavin-dependent oxidoreductase (nitroreductase family)
MFWLVFSVHGYLVTTMSPCITAPLEFFMDYNFFIRWLARSLLHFFISKSVVLISYRGRKSGMEYTTPVNYIEAQEGVLLTTSFKERVWWRNLRGGQEVTVRLRGKDLPARVEVLEEDYDVRLGLAELVQVAPQYRRFLNITLGDDGQPISSSLEDAAKERVVVRTYLY